jgi:phosphatidylserine decarboxylase
MRFRLAPEGWVFILPFVILAAVALLMQWYAAAIVLSLAVLFLINFFRDPHRTGSERLVDVLSPADGTVVVIKDVPDG